MVTVASPFNTPSKIEWDLTNGPRLGSCDRAIRHSGFFGVLSVGPVGEFLEIVFNAFISPMS